ncbi:MAG: LysE family translocator [Sphingomonadales bacterium]
MFWIIPILKGIGQGFLISILSFGPSFFTLINSGIKGGKAEGMRVALGIFLSEFIMALICFFGLSRFFILPEFQLGFSFFAAAAISYIGIRGFYKKYQQFLRSIEQPAAKSKSFFKGFILNLINPFVLLLWVGLLAIVSVYYDKTDPNYEISILINLISILFTLFLLDLGKVYLSDFLGRKLSRRVYYYINKYFGLILLIIGIYFFYHFFTLLVPYLKHGH